MTARRQSKYRAKPVRDEDGYFASRREHKRWQELKLLQQAGAITNLERQKRYVINVNNQKICTYVADFTYSENGRFVVEDSKGFQTPEYKLKRRLMDAVFGIEIRET